ncbi:MAG TPA: hypothetical protein VF543_12560 [Pyrinomonadaceae bacterium]
MARSRMERNSGVRGRAGNGGKLRATGTVAAGAMLVRDDCFPQEESATEIITAIKIRNFPLAPVRIAKFRRRKEAVRCKRFDWWVKVAARGIQTRRLMIRQGLNSSGIVAALGARSEVWAAH